MPRFDKEGFLRDLSDWNPQVASEIAAAEGIELTAAHWEIIELPLNVAGR